MTSKKNNIKEMINDIKQNMPKFSGTETEIQKQVAMYIYLYLGKRKVFDERYFLGNQKYKELMHKKNKKLNIEEISERKRIVCFTLSKLYRYILAEFGIEAENGGVITNDNHICTVIKFSNKTSIIADLQRDLFNIQTHSNTEHFGKDKDYELVVGDYLEDEEIYNLHKKCGYVSSKEDYMDCKIENFKNRVKDLPPDTLLQEIMKDKELNNYQDDIGYIELFTYYTSLIRKIAPEEDKKGINYFNCYVNRIDEKGEEYKDYTMCIYSIYKDEVKTYLYSNKEKRFIPTSLLKLDELENHGFYLGRVPNEQGVRLIRKYISKEKIKKYLNKNSQKTLTL